MDFGQHFLAAFESTPSNMSSVPFVLIVFITDNIIMRSVIDVNGNKEKATVVFEKISHLISI